MAPKKYYAVMKGRKTGIFTQWEDCKRQVQGFPEAVYKSYPTRQEADAAIAAFARKPWSYSPKKTTATPAKRLLSGTIIADSICVDAACSGNPGNVEYQGVHTTTKEVLFHKGPLAYGTNNLGEFLAIIHGLAYLQQQNSSIPIYTDSMTALSWLRKRKASTTLARTARNDEIFTLLDQALAWLEVNAYSNQILKWDTEHWGEIPADFGRR